MTRQYSINRETIDSFKFSIKVGTEQAGATMPLIKNLLAGGYDCPCLAGHAGGTFIRKQNKNLCSRPGEEPWQESSLKSIHTKRI